jgi:hypothetical protein
MKARPSHQMIIDKAVTGHSAFRGRAVAAVTALTPHCSSIGSSLTSSTRPSSRTEIQSTTVVGGAP